MAVKALNEAWITNLTRLIGANKVKVFLPQRTQFSSDEGHFRGILPEVVLEPTSVAEVSGILKFCNEVKCPVVPFGTGTGLEGGSISTQPGGTLSLLQLEGGVTSLNPEDFDCSVRPSVTRIALNEHIRNTGLFFSVDPGADASVCGMVATGASGTNTVRYGTIKQNVLNLEVVLADGTVLHTRGKDRRPRLHPRPTAIAAAVAPFSSLHAAVTSVVEVLQCAIPIARIGKDRPANLANPLIRNGREPFSELLDESQISASNSYSHTNLPVAPTLFLEFHGATEAEVAKQSELVADICNNNNAIEYTSCNEETMAHLWKARHNAYYAALALRKGATGFCTDVCVPITKLTSVIEDTKKDLEKNRITGTIVGHVGDGNFHVILPVYKEDSNEMEAVFSFSNRLVQRALVLVQENMA